MCSGSSGMGWEGGEELGLYFDVCLRAGPLVLRQTWEQPWAFTSSQQSLL